MAACIQVLDIFHDSLIIWYGSCCHRKNVKFGYVWIWCGDAVSENSFPPNPKAVVAVSKGSKTLLEQSPSVFNSGCLLSHTDLCVVMARK